MNDAASMPDVWFAGSHVKRDDGTPLTVYHGTNATFDKFDQRFNALSPRGDSGALGFHFADSKAEARHYGKRVIAAHLALKNPAYLTSSEFSRATNSRADARALRKELEDKGHDGAKTPLGEWIAFHPHQIRTVDAASIGEESPGLLAQHKRLRQTPDAYRRVVGKCPDGLHYDTKSKHCRPDRTIDKVINAPVVAITRAEHKVAASVRKGVNILRTAFGKGTTPQSVQKAAHAAGMVLTKAFKAYFIPWIAGEAVVEQIAKDKGLTNIEAKRVRSICTVYDALNCKALVLGLEHSVGPQAAAASIFFPTASLAYIAASAAKHPIAVARAAIEVTQRVAKKITTRQGESEETTNEQFPELNSAYEALNHYQKRYPIIRNKTVSGMRVLHGTPNLSSIDASLSSDRHMLKGTREVSMDDFDGPKSVFYAKDDFDRSDRLAEKIKRSGKIRPLIVVAHKDGPYFLEGVHRYVALHKLGVKTFPAKVVVDKESFRKPKTSEATEAKRETLSVGGQEARKVLSRYVESTDPFASMPESVKEPFRQFMVYCSSWMAGNSELTMVYGIKQTQKLWKENPGLRAWLAANVNPKQAVTLYYGAVVPKGKPVPEAGTKFARNKQDVFHWSRDKKTSAQFAGFNKSEEQSKAFAGGYLLSVQTTPEHVIISLDDMVKLATRHKESFDALTPRSDVRDLFTSGNDYEGEVLTDGSPGTIKVLAAWKDKAPGLDSVLEHENPDADDDWDEAQYAQEADPVLNPSRMELLKRFQRNGQQRFVLFTNGTVAVANGLHSIHREIVDYVRTKLKIVSNVVLFGIVFREGTKLQVGVWYGHGDTARKNKIIKAWDLPIIDDDKGIRPDEQWNADDWKVKESSGVEKIESMAESIDAASMVGALADAVKGKNDWYFALLSAAMSNADTTPDAIKLADTAYTDTSEPQFESVYHTCAAGGWQLDETETEDGIRYLVNPTHKQLQHFVLHRTVGYTARGLVHGGNDLMHFAERDYGQKGRPIAGALVKDNDGRITVAAGTRYDAASMEKHPTIKAWGLKVTHGGWDDVELEESVSAGQVEKNLVKAGHELRDNGNGHWVLPNGKGLSPTNKRGIVNHHEAYADAGYGKVHPGKTTEAVNSLLQKGWLRRTGQLSYATWGLPERHVKTIEGDLDRERRYVSEPEHSHVYISVKRPDASGEDTHHFTMKDYADSGYNLRKTLRRPDKDVSSDDTIQWTLESTNGGKVNETIPLPDNFETIKTHALDAVRENPGISGPDVLRHARKLSGEHYKTRHVKRALSHLEAEGKIKKRMAGMGFKYSVTEGKIAPLHVAEINGALRAGGFNAGKLGRREKKSGYNCRQFNPHVVSVEYHGWEEADPDFQGKSEEAEKHLIAKGYHVHRPWPDKTLLAITKPSATNEDAGLLKRHKMLRSAPDQYRREVGKCPHGFHYGGRGIQHCVPNLTPMTVTRHVGRDVKKALHALTTKQGQQHAMHAVGHTAIHVAKDVGKLLLLPVDVAKGIYHLSTKPAKRHALYAKIKHVVKTETKQTIATVSTLAKMATGQDTTHEERVAAANQAVDLIKIAAATTIVGSWAAGGVEELAKELLMPWDDLAGTLVDGPLRLLTAKYIGGNSVHGLLPQSFYEKPKESVNEEDEDLSYILKGKNEIIPYVGREKGEVKPDGISELKSEYGSHRYIKSVDGKAVAAIHVTPPISGNPPTVGAVYTLPEHRRKGYAKELFQYAKQKFPNLKHSSHRTLSGETFIKGVGEAEDNDVASHILVSIAAMASAHKPTYAELETALKGKYPDDKVQAFLTQAKSKGLAESAGEYRGTDYVLADLAEMSISRIVHHTDAGNGYAILSPDRSERSQAENKDHRKALLAHIRSMGKGYTHVKGGYVEQTPTGPRSVYEHSIMVHNVNKDEAAALAKHAYEHHQQEAILHVHPKEGPHLIFGQSGNREKVGDKLTTQPAGAYFTQFKHHRFGFKDAPKMVAASVQDVGSVINEWNRYRLGLSGALREDGMEPVPDNTVWHAWIIREWSPIDAASIEEGTIERKSWLTPEGNLLSVPGRQTHNEFAKGMDEKGADGLLDKGYVRIHQAGSEALNLHYKKEPTTAQKTALTKLGGITKRGGIIYADHHKGWSIFSKPGEFEKHLSESLYEAKRESLQTKNGTVHMVWNPSKDELAHMAEKHGHVRGMAFGKDYGFWPSYEAIHYHVADALGMNKKGGEDWYKSRTEIVPSKELNDPERYRPEVHDEAGPYVIYSPDYGDGLKHSYFDKLKLKEKTKNVGYDGDQLRIPRAKFKLTARNPFEGTRSAGVGGFFGNGWARRRKRPIVTPPVMERSPGDIASNCVVYGTAILVDGKTVPTKGRYVAVSNVDAIEHAEAAVKKEFGGRLKHWMHQRVVQAESVLSEKLYDKEEATINPPRKEMEDRLNTGDHRFVIKGGTVHIGHAAYFTHASLGGRDDTEAEGMIYKVNGKPRVGLQYAKDADDEAVRNHPIIKSWGFPVEKQGNFMEGGYHNPENEPERGKRANPGQETDPQDLDESSLEGMRGLWHNPATGETHELEAGQSHNQFVAKHPEKFGLKPKEVSKNPGQAKYRAVEKGWTRIEMAKNGSGQHNVAGPSEGHVAKAVQYMSKQPEWEAGKGQEKSVMYDIHRGTSGTMRGEHLDRVASGKTQSLQPPQSRMTVNAPMAAGYEDAETPTDAASIEEGKRASMGAWTAAPGVHMFVTEMQTLTLDDGEGGTTTATFNEVMQSTLMYGGWTEDRESYVHWRYPKVRAYLTDTDVTFRGDERQITEVRRDVFAGTPLDEASVTATTANDPAKDFKKQDVQQYFDMLVLKGDDTDDALSRTKKQFHLTTLKLTPALRITSPELPDDDGNDKLDTTFPTGSDPAMQLPPDGPDNYADDKEQESPQDSDTNKPVDNPRATPQQ